MQDRTASNAAHSEEQGEQDSHLMVCQEIFYQTLQAWVVGVDSQDGLTPHDPRGRRLHCVSRSASTPQSRLVQAVESMSVCGAISTRSRGQACRDWCGAGVRLSLDPCARRTCGSTTVHPLPCQVLCTDRPHGGCWSAFRGAQLLCAVCSGLLVTTTTTTMMMMQREMPWHRLCSCGCSCRRGEIEGLGKHRVAGTPRVGACGAAACGRRESADVLLGAAPEAAIRWRWQWCGSVSSNSELAYPKRSSW